MSCPFSNKSKSSAESCPITSSNTNENITTMSSSDAKLKICCACPETKKIRDECMFKKGEEFCSKEIADHITCLRNLGFKI